VRQSIRRPSGPLDCGCPRSYGSELTHGRQGPHGARGGGGRPWCSAQRRRGAGGDLPTAWRTPSGRTATSARRCPNSLPASRRPSRSTPRSAVTSDRCRPAAARSARDPVAGSGSQRPRHGR